MEPLLRNKKAWYAKSNLLGFALLAVVALGGCKSSPGSSIFQRDQPPSIKIEHHVVSSGETMYSIAWRYEMDYQTLAHYNGIGPPYTIYPGQKLVLTSPATGRVSSTSTPASSGSSAVVVTPVPTPRVSAGTTVQTAPAPVPVAAPSNLPATVSTWKWPVSGRITSAFGSNGGLQKGIMLAVNEGDPVYASANGEVVYAGSGLRGFGNLVIIKHTNLYLSAYAHNSKLLVKEGDSVSQGGAIAEAGRDLDGNERLYFEIRRDGKPVDPIGYLPKR